MLDLETLGTGPTAAIVSVGACAFDLETGVISPDTFHQKVEFTPTMGTIDPSTVLWWFEQSQEARDALLEGERLPLVDVLRNFRAWAQKDKVDGLWSNGPTFDEVIIRNACERMGVYLGISFRQSRCCRTFFMLARDYKMPRSAFDGVKHNALDDAINQARAMCEVYGRAMNGPAARERTEGAEL